MSRLKITPDVFYDLTLPETLAMLDGEHERQVLVLRMLRRIATLSRNIGYKDPVDELKYIPLPGDEELMQLEQSSTVEVTSKEFMQAFRQAFRGN